MGDALTRVLLETGKDCATMQPCPARQTVSLLSCIHLIINIPAVTNAAALRYANSKYCMDMSGGEVSNGGAADAKVTRTCI